MEVDASLGSLLRVLHHNSLQTLFLAFCASQHNDENVRLWLAGRQWRAEHAAGNEEARDAIAAAIVQLFIREDSPAVVNMVDAVRSKVSAAASAGEVLVFAEELAKLEAAAIKDMRRDMFPRFARSPGLARYQELLREGKAEAEALAGGLDGAEPPQVFAGSALAKPAVADAAAGGGGPGAVPGGAAPVYSLGTQVAAARLLNLRGKRTKAQVNTLVAAAALQRGGRKTAAPAADAAWGTGPTRSPSPAAKLRQQASTRGTHINPLVRAQTMQRAAAMADPGPAASSDREQYMDGGGSSGAHSEAGSEGQSSLEVPTLQEQRAVSQRLRARTRVLGMSMRLHMAGTKRAARLMVQRLQPVKLHEGFVYKRGAKHSAWYRRWYILTSSVLVYCTAHAESEPRGMVYLPDVTQVLPDGGPNARDRSFTFALVTPYRVYELQASSARDHARWLANLQAILIRLATDGASSVDEAELRRLPVPMGFGESRRRCS